MSGGRVELGLGAGWYDAEHTAYGIGFPSLGERFDRLGEQLEIITGLWTTPPGETFTQSVQGRTTDTAHALLAARDSSMETAYVALTTGREANHAYVACVDVDGEHGGGAETPEAVLAAIISRSAIERTATELVADRGNDSLAHLVPAAADLADQRRSERTRRRLTALGRDDLDVEDPAGLDRLLSTRGGDPMGDLSRLLAPLATSTRWTRADMTADAQRALLGPPRPPCGVGDPGADPSHDSALRALQGRIRAREQLVGDQVLAEQAPWTRQVPRSAGTPQWEANVRTLAVYRERWAVDDQHDPLGPRPAGRGPRAEAWVQAYRRLSAGRTAAVAAPQPRRVDHRPGF